MNATKLRVPGRASHLLALALGLLLAGSAGAAVKLPRIFTDHMVLQREVAVPVWGWADAGATVTVEFAGQQKSATAGPDGKWMVKLDPLPASTEPRELVVRAGAAEPAVRFTDVLVGEVWLCSGQSNMQWGLGSSDRSAEEVAAANWPLIRHIAVPNVTAAVPQPDLRAEWRVCSPQVAAGFTAVGYFFGRELHRALNVPVGLINASWGGTRIEPWTPPAGFAVAKSLSDILQRVQQADPRADAYKAHMRSYLADSAQWLSAAQKALETEALVEPPPVFPPEFAPLNKNTDPCALYNAMVHPLVPYALRGAIWYQGESNHGEGPLYTDKMRALIEGWRGLWSPGPLPFYFVQIAPFQYGSEDPSVLPVFWEAQAAALAIPHTGMAVIHDVGNTQDIHPRNKQEVGRRLALLALAGTYGKTDVVASGPVLKELVPEGPRLRVRFDHAHGGLVARDGKPLSHFEIIGPETDYVPAEAAIDGDSVVLSSPACPAPAAVRFGWHKTAEPNLANGAGLPAAPFRAGKVPQVDWLSRKVPEAAGYRLAYDLDLAKLGGTVTYDENQAAGLTGRFDRVAYFVELQKSGEPVRYLYVSMDAFTGDPKKIGVPVADADATFQVGVSNLTVISNAPEFTNVAAGVAGNLEFWPNNYGPMNQAGVAGASADLYDFGDQATEPKDGYGSMQVHVPSLGRTLFAINNWRAGTGADLGIGNSDGKTRDWTFTGNAKTYSVKRLRVLVRMAR